MGGIGSGRQQQNPSTSSFCQLDVRRLQRQGTFNPGAFRACQWAKDGVVVARAFLSMGARSLTIRYETWKVCPSDVTITVALVRTPCHFGGSRLWFLCPAEDCGRRVAILYGDAGLGCRYCLRPTYPIQMIAPIGRGLAQTQKIRVMLGGSVDMALPFPARPKGMHQFTYTKLAIQAMRAESQFNDDVGSWVDSVLSKDTRGNQETRLTHRTCDRSAATEQGHETR